MGRNAQFLALHLGITDEQNGDAVLRDRARNKEAK